MFLGLKKFTFCNHMPSYFVRTEVYWYLDFRCLVIPFHRVTGSPKYQVGIEEKVLFAERSLAYLKIWMICC